MTDLITLSATSDALKVARYFDVLAVGAPVAAKTAVMRNGYKLKAEIRQNASGHGPAPSVEGGPPNAITGKYVNSWRVQFFPEFNGGYTGVIGTDADQGRRLEWGFHGTDSLGRTYNQGPRPHVGPAVRKIENAFAEELFALAVHP